MRAAPRDRSSGLARGVLRPHRRTGRDRAPAARPPGRGVARYRGGAPGRRVGQCADRGPGRGGRGGRGGTAAAVPRGRYGETLSEPKGRGAAWTEERGARSEATSDEGRRRLRSAPEASEGHKGVHRFRVWAPDRNSVDVVIGERRVALGREESPARDPARVELHRGGGRPGGAPSVPAGPGAPRPDPPPAGSAP